MRRSLIWSAPLAIGLLGSPSTALAQTPASAGSGVPNGAPTSAPAAVPAPLVVKDLEREKVANEIDKLKSEIDKLKQETSPLGRLSNLAAGWGGIAGAIVAFFVWLLGTRVTDAYAKNQKDAQRDTNLRHDERLARDQELNREQHNLKLFSELANDNPRAQVAAAIVLLGRLTELREVVLRVGPDGAFAPAIRVTKSELEQQSIRSVLAAVLKKDPSNSRNRRAFFKTVAEGLVKDLGALCEDRTRLPADLLHRFDDFTAR